MGNCKDCKYWTKHTDDWNRTWHTCEGVGDTHYSAKIVDDNFALYAESLDDSGLEFGMKTGPMFGCVRFVQKD